jgi:hypothetical protein
MFFRNVAEGLPNYKESHSEDSVLLNQYGDYDLEIQENVGHGTGMHEHTKHYSLTLTGENVFDTGDTNCDANM